MSKPGWPERLEQMLYLHDDALWHQTVIAGAPVPSFGLRENIDEHLDMLAAEFSGKPVALFAHAALIVMIRRHMHHDACIERFFSLWDKHVDRLASGLDSRWLVSAMDTFADIGRSRDEQSLALAGTLFMNTVKLYETERHVTGQRASPSPFQPMSGRVALDDGMSAFVIGSGDMVFNLVARTRRGCVGAGPVGVILRTLLERACGADTVFHRFRQAHEKPETKW